MFENFFPSSYCNWKEKLTFITDNCLYIGKIIIKTVIMVTIYITEIILCNTYVGVDFIKFKLLLYLFTVIVML